MVSYPTKHAINAILAISAALHAYPSFADSEAKPTITFAYSTDSSEEEAKGYTRQAQTIASHANFDVDVVELPVKRSLEMLKHNVGPICFMHAYWRENRLSYVKYTNPISKDPPFVIVTLSENADKIRKYNSLKRLYADLSISAPVRPEDVSFGIDYIDNLASSRTTNSFNVLVPSEHLTKLLESGRLDWNLQFPNGETTQYMLAKGLPIELITFDDIPPGNIRYIMCSKAVTDETIERINEALAVMYPNGIPDFPGFKYSFEQPASLK